MVLEDAGDHWSAVVSTEEEAWELFQRALAGEFAEKPLIPSFKGWPTQEITFWVGDKHEVLTAPMMEALLDYQRGLYRSFLFLTEDTTNLRRLSEELRARYEVEFQVDGNLDLSLSVLLSALLDIPIRVAEAIYFTPKAAIARVDILANTVEAKFAFATSHEDPDIRKQYEAELAHIRALVKRSKASIGKRHAVMHDLWGASGADRQTVMRAALPAPPGAVEAGEHVSIIELEKTISQVRQLISDIRALAAEIQRRRADSILAAARAVE